MKRTMRIWLPVLTFCLGVTLAIKGGQEVKSDGYLLERDAEVAKDEPGPHDGGGPSTGYLFFDKAPNLKFSFRKRVLHKGAAIGYHLQKTDEVYYFTGGEGGMTINDKPFTVKEGDCVRTRGGRSHSLRHKAEADVRIRL